MSDQRSCMTQLIDSWASEHYSLEWVCSLGIWLLRHDQDTVKIDTWLQHTRLKLHQQQKHHHEIILHRLSATLEYFRHNSAFGSSSSLRLHLTKCQLSLEFATVCTNVRFVFWLCWVTQQETVVSKGHLKIQFQSGDTMLTLETLTVTWAWSPQSHRHRQSSIIGILCHHHSNSHLPAQHQSPVGQCL